MKPTRTVLVALLAWMLCFQALAGVPCRHAGHAAHASAAQAEAMPGMQHVAQMLHMQGGHHASPAHGAEGHAPLAGLADCAGNAACTAHCAMSGAGLVGLPASVILQALSESPLQAAAPAGLAAAHGLGLFRPPSIS